MERTDIIYNERDIAIITELRKQALSQFKLIEIMGMEDKNTIIYPNQEKTAYRIVEQFVDKRVICVLVIQPTQSGKTGVMYATSKLFIENPLYMLNPKNIHIISGLSSTDWKKQTIERFPEFVSNNIYHRNNLNNFLEKLKKDPRNSLIIMDEIHIANTNCQTIFNTLKEAKLFDFEFLCKNNIKIIQFSATPDGCLYDLKKWNDCHYKVLQGEVDTKYTGAIDILEDGRVFPFKPLISYISAGTTKQIDPKSLENVKEIKMYLEDNFTEPSYIVIRLSTKVQEYNDTMNNLKKVFNDTEFNYIEYNQASKIDINVLCFNQKPHKTTIIIIKEKLRVAFTINPTYISILYDRYVKNPNDSVIIQSLIGRATGHRHNNKMLIFTNIQSILKYDKLHKSEFKEEDIEWTSLSTKKIKNTIIGVNTFNNAENFNEMTGKKHNIMDCFNVPVLINVTKEDIETICKKTKLKKKEYNQQDILQIVKKYDEKLYEKLCKSEKLLCQVPSSTNNYQASILDKIKKIDKGKKCNFNFFSKTYDPKKNYHNIFIDNKFNRIVFDLYSGELLKEIEETK